MSEKKCTDRPVKFNEKILLNICLSRSFCWSASSTEMSQQQEIYGENQVFKTTVHVLQGNDVWKSVSYTQTIDLENVQPILITNEGLVDQMALETIPDAIM